MRVPTAFVAAVLAVAAPALASTPSTECRDGAPLCRDAFVKLEECEKQNPGKPEACTAERGETDTACRTTASACDRDGSKRAP